MRASISFRPGLIPTLAALAGVVVTALLGNWQLERAAGKAQLQLRIEEASRHRPIHIGVEAVNEPDLVYYPVEARGEFQPDGTVYADNRVHDNVAGYEVITPLKLGNARYVLVNRGWVPAGRDRNALPAVATPAGTVTVEGFALPGNPPVFELSSEVQSGRLWQHVTVERYRKAFALELQPIVIRQQNDPGDGLVREWKRPDAGIERHRAYALQWFSLCVLIIVLYVFLNVKRATPPQRPA
jgi:surfeit locus 1 family protein